MSTFSSTSWRVAQGLAVASLVLSGACATHHQAPNTGNGGYGTSTAPRDANGDVQNERRDDAGRYAHKPPPLNPAENPGPQPGPQYAWVAGHYTWDGNDFQWQPGQWAVPPTGFRTWIPGHWDQVSTNNWAYTEGRYQ